MGFIALFVGLGLFCALLWYCAIYALPVFVGFSTGLWALNHGAGLGCAPIGIVVGASLFTLGRYAVSSGNRLVRTVALAVFVIPAMFMGFEIISQLPLQMGSVWRYIFAAVGGLASGATAFARLSPAHTQEQQAKLQETHRERYRTDRT